MGSIRIGVLCALSIVILLGCAEKKAEKKKKETLVKECVLEPEQANSIQGRWATPPIKVSFKQGDFDSGQIDAIVAGGTTWNGFFTATKGMSIFSIAASNITNLSQATPNCGASAPINDGTVIYKRPSVWTKSQTAVAVTSTCVSKNTNGGLSTIRNAIMEINYVNFFSASSGFSPDLQSIALHELGHLLGLDHSCGPLGYPNSNLPNVGCPDPQSDPSNSLLETVMFPTVFFDNSGQGEVKQSLSANDQGRANCVYE